MKQAKSEANFTTFKAKNRDKPIDQHLYELAQSRKETLEAKKKYYEDEQHKKINESKIP